MYYLHVCILRLVWNSQQVYYQSVAKVLDDEGFLVVEQPRFEFLRFSGPSQSALAFV